VFSLEIMVAQVPGLDVGLVGKEIEEMERVFQPGSIHRPECFDFWVSELGISLKMQSILKQGYQVP